MKFYDTNALLELQEEVFDDKLCISFVTLAELEHIKTDRQKDEEVKYKARNIVRLLEQNEDKYELIGADYTASIEQLLQEYNLEKTNDNLICASALAYDLSHEEETIFVTNDILCKMTAKHIFKLTTEYAVRHATIYKGYVEVNMDEEEMAYFFSHMNENIYDLKVNEYVIIENLDKDNIYKWNGEEYIKVIPQKFKSRAFGTVKPLNNTQTCAFDSINDNKITMLFGKASSGKTYLSLAYADAMLDKEGKDITFIYSYANLKGSKELGYEKGSHIEKLLNTSSMGNILASKYGDIVEVEKRLEQGTLNIIPTSSIRGISIKNSIVIVTEAQNLDAYTLKTIIQRCEFDTCKLIIEGDMIEQKDVLVNVLGMKRFVDVFSGNPEVGIIKLKGNYRSHLGEIADEM